MGTSRKKKQKQRQCDPVEAILKNECTRRNVLLKEGELPLGNSRELLALSSPFFIYGSIQSLSDPFIA